MKTGIYKYSFLASAMLFSSLAMANPSATLAVKGQVSTGTCTAVLPSSNIDLGNISADTLPATGALEVLSGHYSYLQITCTSPLKYQVSITDNRADSAIPASEVPKWGAIEGSFLGLGKTTDNKNIGGYLVSWQNVTPTFGGDDYQGMIYRSSAADSSWQSAPGGLKLTPQNNTKGNFDRTYIAMADTGTLVPKASKTAEFKFATWAYISSELRSITDQQSIDGNMTFNVDYL